ncbi:MAG TPA: hypothetical protein VGG75_03240 [Trebonia sp.]|jgi:hypothetical protein
MNIVPAISAMLVPADSPVNTTAPAMTMIMPASRIQRDGPAGTG